MNPTSGATGRRAGLAAGPDVCQLGPPNALGAAAIAHAAKAPRATHGDFGFIVPPSAPVVRRAIDQLAHVGDDLNVFRRYGDGRSRLPVVADCERDKVVVEAPMAALVECVEGLSYRPVVIAEDLHELRG